VLCLFVLVVIVVIFILLLLLLLPFRQCMYDVMHQKSMLSIYLIHTKNTMDMIFISFTIKHKIHSLKILS